MTNTMNKTTRSLLAGVLASVACAAGASIGSAAHGQQNQPVVVAQTEAVADYRAYLGRMMKDDSTMQMLDKNGDGEISRDEFTQFHKAVFDSADKNKDGKLIEEEMPEQPSQQG